MTGPDDAGLPAPTPGARAPRSVPLTTRQNLRGHYAGFASRFIAFAFDCAVSVGAFELALVAASFAASVLVGTPIHWNKGSIGVIFGFFAWEFFYYAYFWTASGKTPGMVLLGVQVVGEEGGRAGTRRGLIRTLAFPLSFILGGLGFLGILLGRDRRALHDVIAGTAVVYCWDAREARLRSLARRGGSRRATLRPGAGRWLASRSRPRWGVRVASGRLGLLRYRARPGLFVNGVRPWLFLSRARLGLWLSGVRPGLLVGRVEDALGHGHQAVSPLADLVEPLEKPLDPVLEPFHGIPERIRMLRPARIGVGAAVADAGRPGRARGAGRPGRPGRRMVAPTAKVLAPPPVLTGQFPFLVGRFLGRFGGLLGRVGGLLGGVGGFLRRVGLSFGQFGSGVSLFGRDPGLIGSPQGPVDLRFVRPLLRHLGGFLGQIGGLIRRVGGLFRSFSALSRPLGPLARPVGQVPSLGGRLPRIELGVAEVGFPSRAVVPLVIDRVVRAGGVVLVFDGAPGHAVRFARLGHALAGGDLPGLVLSHDHFFPAGRPASARHGERS